MSILLNALKKSEAQRQVGSPPDIHAPVDLSQEKNSGGNRWLLWILLTVVALVMAWFSWQSYHSSEVSVGDESVESAASETDIEPSQDLPAEAEVNMQGDPPAAPPEVIDASANIKVEDEERKQELSRSFTQFEAEPPADTEEAGLAERGDEPVDLSNLESAVDAIAQDISVEEGAQRKPRPGGSRSEPARSETGLETDSSEPISFWQVPQNLRDSLPEFRITVLVYAEEPADRFVLINGVRLIEQEELEPGVTLDEIRRDGAVFLYRNYRFLVKG